MLNSTAILDFFYKKTIDYKYQDKILKFKVSQDLFSSHAIDIGTQRLLRTFLTIKEKYGRILDLGCGYGPIGITFKSIFPSSEVHMTDRDVLALEFTKINTELNNIEGVQIYGSLGYDNVTEKEFDLILSNIPAKVGNEVLNHMLLDAKYFLNKDGLVAVVVVDAILNEVEEILSNDEVEIKLKKSWPGHTVFHYKFSENAHVENYTSPKSFETGLYDRTEMSLIFKNHKYILKTTYNLPDFDKLSYEADLLLESLQNSKNKIYNLLSFNLNQGHIAAALSGNTDLKEINLVDRNLQSLKVTERNLILNGFPKEKIKLHHQIDIHISDSFFDLIIGVLEEKEERNVNALFCNQAAEGLVTGGNATLASSSNIIVQIENVVKQLKGISIDKKTKYRGKRLISFVKTS